MAAPNRKVLLCYLENKKALMLPPKAEVEDLSYLNNEFLMTFSFQSNVKLRVTFQQYDEMWREYVDLNESDVIFDKDKLKVVVTLLLTTPYSPQYISETSSNDTPSLSRPVKRQGILDDDDDNCVTLAISDDSSARTLSHHCLAGATSGLYERQSSIHRNALLPNYFQILLHAPISVDAPNLTPI
uniref:Uncharacterized protein n=1 Tax=Amphimedon queenslandica TaxID=400682 RepID=A0A1X7V838_AMPQE